MLDHLLFNRSKFYPIDDYTDLITADSQKFVKSYIGRKATAGAHVHCYETENDMQYWFKDGQVNVGDTVTYQIIDNNNEIWLNVNNNNEIWLSADNRGVLRPIFKLSDFLKNGGKL